MSALVIRRALGSARDARSVSALCADAGIAIGDALPSWLSSDEQGLALLAERGGRAVGVAIVRLLKRIGGGAVEAALLDAVYVAADARRQGVGRALVEAARAESEAREAQRFAVLARDRDEASRAFLAAVGIAAGDAPAARGAAPEPSREETSGKVFQLADGVSAVFIPSAQTPETVARWSGAQAIRTRWRDDLSASGWSVEGCVGTRGDDGDALRFDPTTGLLREAYLGRPVALRFDDELLARVAALPDHEGALTVSVTTPPFELAATDFALFDVSLGWLVALRAEAVEALAGDAASVTAVRLCDRVSIVFASGRYAGWRARDPVAIARPMGWPEGREPRELSADERAALTSLVYDWMVIDASPRIEPAEAEDPEDIAHMTALRERARALSERDGDADERDPVGGVARDVAAQILWGWGFYKIGA
ncbi:MAG: GNAT family N-acetyltransferase [Polyangiales bacterium]